MTEFKAWFDTHYPGVIPKSTPGKAFNYALARWDGFCAYLDDGRIEIDNNHTEQQITPFVIARKNFMFAHSVRRCPDVVCALLPNPHRQAARPRSILLLRGDTQSSPPLPGVDDYEARLPWNIALDAHRVPARAA